MKCELTIKTEKGKNGQVYDNLILTTEKGTSFQVKYAFYNRKLAYKVKKEIEG